MKPHHHLTHPNPPTGLAPKCRTLEKFSKQGKGETKKSHTCVPEAKCVGRSRRDDSTVKHRGAVKVHRPAHLHIVVSHPWSSSKCD